MAPDVLTARGTVRKGGRRIAFAEGEVTDAQGRVVATATSTFLVFGVPRRVTEDQFRGMLAESIPFH
ncbi:PaaI family thioesterase [Aeromicrobium sp.]